VSPAPRLGFISPQLPSLTDQPPQGAHWIHDVKHDGYRTILVIERSIARAYTRNVILASLLLLESCRAGRQSSMAK
jgi:ATP-dependent DNA ligase